MAERRMFTKRVTDDDHFMGLSASAQALYLHLMMAADDDGFCNQIAVCMFKAHASTSDLEALLANRYLYQFDNGVIVIKHWRMANALRKDRYTPTAFQEELAKLELKDNGAYTLVANRLPDGCQVVAACLPQDRLGKDSVGKDRLDKDKPPSGVCRFAPPTLEEVTAYCRERGNKVDPQKFIDFYESKGWMIGKNKMKNWKAAVRTWERSEPKQCRMSSRWQDHYDKWHPECERRGSSAVARLEDIELHMEDFD